MVALISVISTIIGLAIILGIIYILMTKTAPKRAAAQEFMSTEYAHRGLHDVRLGVAENSIRAFELAVEKGYGIELDVQLSKDGIPMVFHDATLNRVCGIDGRLCDYTCDELHSFTLCGFEGQNIPTLREVLDTVDGRARLVVEIKSDFEPIKTTEAAQEILDTYTGAYCVESFDPFIIKWYKNERPDIVRGLLSDMFSRNGKCEFKLLLLQTMFLNSTAEPDFIAYNFKHKDSLPFRIVKKLWKPYTLAWTPRSDADAAQCTDFDTVIFETTENDL